MHDVMYDLVSRLCQNSVFEFFIVIVQTEKISSHYNLIRCGIVLSKKILEMVTYESVYKKSC